MKGRRKEEKEEDVYVHVSIEKVGGTYKNWLCLHKKLYRVHVEPVNAKTLMLKL